MSGLPNDPRAVARVWMCPVSRLLGGLAARSLSASRGVWLAAGECLSVASMGMISYGI